MKTHMNVLIVSVIELELVIFVVKKIEEMDMFTSVKVVVLNATDVMAQTQII